MCLVCVFLSQEKDAALSDDYGKDLASVQALQRKHEGFEVCRLCAYLQLACMVSLSSCQEVTYPRCTVRQMARGA